MVLFHSYLYSSLSYLFYRRYLTVLFYLSSAEEGGETTFPVADNRTYNEQVSVLPPPTIINQQGLFPFWHFEMMTMVHDLNAADNTHTVMTYDKESDI